MNLNAICLGALMFAGIPGLPQARDQGSFAGVNGTGFVIGERPYYFPGANFWYGLNLGSAGYGRT